MSTEMKIEVDGITLDSKHDQDRYDDLDTEHVTVQIGSERESVKIETLIKALEAMRSR